MAENPVGHVPSLGAVTLPCWSCLFGTLDELAYAGNGCSNSGCLSVGTCVRSETGARWRWTDPTRSRRRQSTNHIVSEIAGVNYETATLRGLSLMLAISMAGKRGDSRNTLLVCNCSRVRNSPSQEDDGLVRVWSAITQRATAKERFSHPPGKYINGEIPIVHLFSIAIVLSSFPLSLVCDHFVHSPTLIFPSTGAALIIFAISIPNLP